MELEIVIVALYFWLWKSLDTMSSYDIVSFIFLSIHSNRWLSMLPSLWLYFNLSWNILSETVYWSLSIFFNYMVMRSRIITPSESVDCHKGWDYYLLSLNKFSDVRYTSVPTSILHLDCFILVSLFLKLMK